MKKLLLLLLASTMLYACSEIEVEDVKEVGSSEEVKEVKSIKIDRAPQYTPEQILKVYEDTLSNDYTVGYIEDKKIFTFMIHNPFLKLDLKDIMENKQPLDGWNKIVDSLRVLSLATMDKIGEGYSHAILNPFNENNVILVIKDGTVVMDAFNKQ